MPPNLSASTLGTRYDAALDLYAARPKQLPPLRSAYKCLRILLLVFNLMVMIFGCILIGDAGLASQNVANSFVGETLPIGLTAIGAFTIILALVGALAAWRQSRVLLWTYNICLMLIVIVMFSLALAIYVKRNQMSTYVEQGWQSTSYAFRDTVQNELMCCGLKVYGQMAGAPDGHGCPHYPPPPAHTVNVTCFEVIKSIFASNYKQLGGAGIAFAVLMTLGIVVVAFLDRGVNIHRKAIQSYEEEYKKAEEEEDRLDELESDSEDDSASGSEDSDDSDDSEQDETDDAKQSTSTSTADSKAVAVTIVSSPTATAAASANQTRSSQTSKPHTIVVETVK